MGPRTKRIIKLIAGWVFIVLGFVGLFLPVLQGILFLLIGLLLISNEYAWARRLMERFKMRYPQFDRTLQKCREKYKL
jgi:uncharacterized membrane protein YbaN (DUF454 family)